MHIFVFKTRKLAKNSHAYNLSDNYAGKTTLIAGEMYRHGSEWKFSAVGEGTQDKNL